MEHIKVEENKLYNFYTLTADEGFVISNTRNGFDADKYIGTEKIVVPKSVDYESFIAIPKEQHDKYLKMIDMYLLLKINNPPIVI